jgi:hypothetical protein
MVKPYKILPSAPISKLIPSAPLITIVEPLHIQSVESGEYTIEDQFSNFDNKIDADYQAKLESHRVNENIINGNFDGNKIMKSDEAAVKYSQYHAVNIHSELEKKVVVSNLSKDVSFEITSIDGITNHRELQFDRDATADLLVPPHSKYETSEYRSIYESSELTMTGYKCSEYKSRYE